MFNLLVKILHKNSILAIGLVLAKLAIASSGAVAQVVPDATLSATERSQVSPGPVFRIEGGAKRDSNLFHSFQDFSVPTGSVALFDNAPTIANIITRVTGKSVSNIDGLIQARGSANLFLLNPNGISFGPHASLNMNGSFVATTANAIGFGDRGLFSATTPENPSLLTIAPSALLFNQLAASITSQAVLQVPKSQSLLLVGGHVNLDGGQLVAPGGRVELAGVAGAGTVGLNIDGSNLYLIPNGVAPADVSLINGAEVNVRAGGGGSIAISARNFEMLGRSSLQAGIASGMGAPDSQAGDIEVNATGTIALSNDSSIANLLLGQGNGGNIKIAAESVSLRDGAQVNASIFGRGNAGSVVIRAADAVSVEGENSNGSSTAVYSRVRAGAVGNSGGIDITAGSLSVTDGAVVSADTLERGNGNAGRVTIFTRGAVSFAGVGSDGTPSGAYSSVLPDAVGSSGGIDITSGSLSVTNGARLNASTFGRGDAGQVTIQVAGTASFDGERPNGVGDAGGIYSFVDTDAVGNSGGIYLTAGSLSVTNGAGFVASTFGTGKAGGVKIQVGGAAVFAGENQQGDSSGVFSSVGGGAVGNSGEIALTAESLSVTHGATLTASTLGQGDAGSVILRVGSQAVFDGVGEDGYPSSVFSRVRAGSLGKGGDIEIASGSLSVTNGAVISARSQEVGRAGSITINTNGTLRASNGNISTSADQSAGGAITVTAKDMRLDNSNITTSVFSGEGGGGDINLTARSIVAFNDSNILAFARDGRGGNITLNTPAFFGFRYQPAPSGTDPTTLIGNGRVDINASGQVSSGTISLPDVTPVQNALTKLPTNPIDTDSLLANSCLVRTQQQGSFTIAGTGGLPQQPNDPANGAFETYALATPSTDAVSSTPLGRREAPLAEARGIYRLANGQLVLSRQCSR